MLLSRLLRIISKKRAMGYLGFSFLKLLVSVFDIAILVLLGVYISTNLGGQAGDSQAERIAQEVLSGLSEAVGAGALGWAMLGGLIIRVLLQIGLSLFLWWLSVSTETILASRLIEDSFLDTRKESETLSTSAKQNKLLVSVTAVSKGYGAIASLLADIVFSVALIVVSVTVSPELTFFLLAVFSMIGIAVGFVITPKVKRANRSSLLLGGQVLQALRDAMLVRREVFSRGLGKTWRNVILKPRSQSARAAHYALFLNNVPRVLLEGTAFAIVLIFPSASRGLLDRSCQT